MTPAQFALAAGTDLMWVRNARRALGRPRRNHAGEARWFGLVHDLQSSLGIALGDAARIADLASTAPGTERAIEVAVDPGRSVSVTIDLVRARTLHELRLAAALHLPMIDHRGRPATSYRATVAELARGVRRGSDPIRLALSAKRPAADRLTALGSMAELLIGLANANVRFVAIGEVAGALIGTLRRPSVVDVLYDSSDHASVDALAWLLGRWHARPRGAEGSVSPLIDAALIGVLPALALDTDLGALNLWTRCPVIGDYAAAQNHVLDDVPTGLPIPVLDVAALMAMERGKGRGVDHDLLYELRQLGVERRRAARLERYCRSISSSCATTRA